MPPQGSSWGIRLSDNRRTISLTLETNKQTGSSKYYPSEIISPQFKGVVFSLSQTLTEALAFFIAHSSKL